VNGSGAVTVTDGVLVLRMAAGLPVTGNCASPSGGCDLTILTNGPSPGTATSVWSCVTAFDGHGFQFALYKDFTGTSTDIGPFSFLQNGCLQGIATALAGPLVDQQARITNLNRTNTMLTFHQEGFGGQSDISCALQTF